MTRSRSFFPLLPVPLLAGITLVLLVAALMRLYHITQQSLWFDEAFAWNIVIQPDMFPRIAADTHPPLYYLLLRLWVGVMSDTPLALRALSALTSMLTVAFVYRVGCELIHRLNTPDRRYRLVPLIAALLLALTDAEIDLAQETRNYALYTGLACLSMWLYLRWLRKAPSRRPPPSVDVIAWCLANAALVYTHYQGAFIPGIQGVHALLFLRGRVRMSALGGLLVSGLLLAPWLILVTIPQAQRAIALGTPFAIPSNWATVLHLRREFLGQMWSLLLVLLLLGAWALVSRTRGRGVARVGDAALIVGWVVIPVVVLFVGNFYAELLTERKLAIVTPAIALLAAFGLVQLRPPATGLVLLAMVIYVLVYVDSYRLKEPWDAVAEDAARYAQAGDLALIEMGNGQYPMKYYWQHTLPAGATISTFPVLGDPTMAPTTDWFTYYDGLLPQQIAETLARRSGPVATAWLGFWSKETASIARLEAAGFVRTMTTTHTHLGHALDLYRYDHLPAQAMAVFENGLILRAVEINPAALRVDLWWSLSAPLTTEVVTSALLLDANGVLAAQMDSVPFYGQRSVMGWQPGEVIFDPKPLQIVTAQGVLVPGDYTVVVQAYRFDASGSIVQERTAIGEQWVTIGVLQR